MNLENEPGAHLVSVFGKMPAHVRAKQAGQGATSTSWRPIGVSVGRTKMKEKGNSRGQTLHTSVNNILLLLNYLPHPSWARQKTYMIDKSAFYCDLKSRAGVVRTRIYAITRRFSPSFDARARTLR
ncbi:MAG TPA: hypothetical protein VIQ29_01765 [Ancylobacter sp.]